MKRPAILAVIGLLLVVVSYWKLTHRPSFEPEMANEPPADAVAVVPGASPSEDGSSPDGDVTALSTAVPGSESASLVTMAKVVAEFTRRERTMDELLKFLQDSKQEPYVSIDKSIETGDLSIVRTKSPFPGTRYFHAQYFSGNSGDRFLQHMSFEFRPGAQAFEEAMQTVQKNFAGLGKPEIQNKDFVQWDVGDGGVIWIKRMGASDLKDDPFNAYTKDDVGTVRVAYELKPESDEAH